MNSGMHSSHDSHASRHVKAQHDVLEMCLTINWREQVPAFQRTGVLRSLALAQTTRKLEMESLVCSLLDLAEETRQRPLALKLAGCLRVVQAILMVNVHHIMIADGRRARVLYFLVWAALFQDLWLTKALANRLEL